MAERLMSPTGGFLLQSREGNAGNFEVVFAWPDGGLVHYGRANDEPNAPWIGPFHFGRQEHYKGASVVESDFKSHPNRRLGNLEVVATAESGEVHHYWRQNGGAFQWSGPFRVFNGICRHAPSMAYTGRANWGSSFFVVAPSVRKGLQYWERRNGANHIIEWIQHTGVGAEHFVGVALTLTTIGAYSTEAAYPDTGPGGNQIAAAVCEFHNVHLMVEGLKGGAEHRGWFDGAVIGIDVFAELRGQFRGRPSVIQGDFNLDDSGLFDYGHYGNLELIVPHESGGFFHFWRLCGIPMHEVQPISWGWGGPFHVPGPLYEEVSLIQSTFSNSSHGNLEVVARRHGQRGFDFYWRDDRWHGPFHHG